jgi:hypothetical protein
LPAEGFLSSPEAQSVLYAIQQMSKTQRPLCSSKGPAPPSSTDLVRRIGADRHKPPVIPVYDPHHHFPAQIIKIQDIFNQIETNEK